MTSCESIKLTILMPCLNEAKTLPACITKARAYLARQGFQGEIVVADNGSTDGFRDIAEALGVRVIAVPRRGYGNAVRAGIEAARGEFVVMGDSDDSYNFSDAVAGELLSFGVSITDGRTPRPCAFSSINSTPAASQGNGYGRSGALDRISQSHSLLAGILSC